MEHKTRLSIRSELDAYILLVERVSRLEGDSPWTLAWLTLNPLHHLAEGIRFLLLTGELNHHLAAACGLFLLMIAILIPLDERLLRRRVLGEG